MSWMVVMAAHGRERECRKDVRALGGVCYMPTFRERIVVRGKKIWTERLLLGRYFFVYSTPMMPWETVNALRLVQGIFMKVDAEEPALVRDAEVELIRSREDKSGHVTEAARKEFIKGQKVRALMGVMAGNQGQYVGTGRGGCDIAMVELFGRATRIEFAPGVLAAA